MKKSIIIGTIILGILVTQSDANKPINFHDLYIRNHSTAYDSFETVPLINHLSMHFFTIDNSEDFEHNNWSDVRVLKFTEKGPYVYDEFREKIQLEFGHDGNNVSYVEKRWYKFNAELSGKGLSPKDNITIVDMGFGLVSGFFQFVASTRSFKNIAIVDTVENIAFKGMQRLLGQSLFGPQENNLDKETTVDTGKTSIEQIGQYLKFDQDVGRQKVWRDHGTCNELKGTDGTQFLPNLNSTLPLYMFEPMFCKSIKLVHDETVLKSVKVRQLDSVRYYASDDNYVQKSCNCFEDSLNDCPGDLLNLRNCGSAKDVMNMLVSSPYFLENPFLLRNISFVPPKALSQENYGTVFDVEPVTGIVLSARKRFQLNIQLRRELTPLLANLKDKLAFIPLVWVEESNEINEQTVQKLYEIINQTF